MSPDTRGGESRRAGAVSGRREVGISLLTRTKHSPPTRRRRATGSRAAPNAPISLAAHRAAPATPAELWPAEVDLILSALDAAHAGGDSSPGAAIDATHGEGELGRRHAGRMPYRVRGELRLFSDVPGDAPRVLYTRDVGLRGLGFITPHRLPLGYGGSVELFTPRGTKSKIACTVLRCREAATGWYEGALSFNREQWVFAVE